MATDDGMDKAGMAIKRITLFFIAIVVYTGIVGGTGYFAGRHYAERLDDAERTELAEEAEAEYYRGVYDGCMQQFKKLPGASELCGQVTHAVYKSGWYERSSLDWRWPLMEPIKGRNG